MRSAHALPSHARAARPYVRLTLPTSRTVRRPDSRLPPISAVTPRRLKDNAIHRPLPIAMHTTIRQRCRTPSTRLHHGGAHAPAARRRIAGAMLMPPFALIYSHTPIDAARRRHFFRRRHVAVMLLICRFRGDIFHAFRLTVRRPFTVLPAVRRPSFMPCWRDMSAIHAD